MREIVFKFEFTKDGAKEVKKKSSGKDCYFSLFPSKKINWSIDF